MARLTDFHRQQVSKLGLHLYRSYSLNLNRVQIQTSFNLKLQNKIQETPTHNLNHNLKISFMWFYFIRNLRWEACKLGSNLVAHMFTQKVLNFFENAHMGKQSNLWYVTVPLQGEHALKVPFVSSVPYAPHPRLKPP
jgi:hypothetical protein